MSEKRVITCVSGNNITVSVTDAPNYPAKGAIVTVKLLPNGPTKGPDNSQAFPGGHQFEFTNLDPGTYLVSVDCGHKYFARVVEVPDNNCYEFDFKEIKTPVIPPRIPPAIGPLLPTAAELQKLGLTV